MAKRSSHHNFLKGARVYLSGPMDFVSSRERERQFGWRARIGQYLDTLGVSVFDPWKKPQVRGLLEYGREDAVTIEARHRWTFDESAQGAKVRAELAEYFWKTVHIDLRMVDLSDFVIAYCPTNVYSVGTVHEIIVARQQHKPVLFVSPSVDFPSLHKLEAELAGQRSLTQLLDEIKSELPRKDNPRGVPSLWYMPLIGSESFFDGFGFYLGKYHRKFPGWKCASALDEREARLPPSRSLVPFLESLARGRNVPKCWDHAAQRHGDDDDWLLLEEALECGSSKPIAEQKKKTF